MSRLSSPRRGLAFGCTCALLVALTVSIRSAFVPRGDADARADEESEEVVVALTDVTEASGLGAAKGDRFSFGDFDRDGDPDLLIGGSRLWRNDTETTADGGRTIRFTDVTKECGIDDGAGGGACWIDLDLDGDLDVVTTGGAVKIQDDRGRFRDQAAAWGLKLAKAVASLGCGDVDGDGYADVLLGGGEDWNDGNPVYYPQVLLRNVKGERFEEATSDHELGGERYGRAVSFADYDRDGDLDVYLGNYRLQANELLVNDGGRLVNRAHAAGVEGRFTDDVGTLPSGQRVGFHYGHTIASSWADLDADGDLDLWVSNLVHKFVGAQPQFPGGFDYRGWICDDSAIYRSDGAPSWGFTDMRGESGVPTKPIGGRGTFQGDELWSNAAVADLDLDGYPEVFVTQVYQLPYSHSLLFHNLGGFHFEEISGAVGVRRFDSYGAAFADVDGDGDPDLVVNGRPAPEAERGVVLYRNDTVPGPWIAFRLVGARGDPVPVGAQVLLACEDGTMARQVEGAMGSHAQQNEAVLRFGLRGRRPTGAATVFWPGGLVQTLDGLEAGRVHEVVLPKRVPPPIELDAPKPFEGRLKLTARAVQRLPQARWRFDLDGDGTFETEEKHGTVLVEAGGARDVRVRLVPAGKPAVVREAVWHLPAGD